MAISFDATTALRPRQWKGDKDEERTVPAVIIAFRCQFFSVQCRLMDSNLRPTVCKNGPVFVPRRLYRPLRERAAPLRVAGTAARLWPLPQVVPFPNESHSSPSSPP